MKAFQINEETTSDGVVKERKKKKRICGKRPDGAV